LGVDQTESLIISATDNIELNLSYSLESGGIQINLRDSGNGGYGLLLRSDNQAALFRENTLIQTFPLSVNDLSIWHTLTFSVVQGKITVIIDDNYVVDYTDPEPLLGSNVLIDEVSSGTTGLMLDDISILSFVTQLLNMPTPTVSPTIPTIQESPLAFASSSTSQYGYLIDSIIQTERSMLAALPLGPDDESSDAIIFHTVPLYVANYSSGIFSPSVSYDGLHVVYLQNEYVQGDAFVTSDYWIKTGPNPPSIFICNNESIRDLQFSPVNNSIMGIQGSSIIVIPANVVEERINQNENCSFFNFESYRIYTHQNDIISANWSPSGERIVINTVCYSYSTCDNAIPKSPHADRFSRNNEYYVIDSTTGAIEARFRGIFSSVNMLSDMEVIYSVNYTYPQPYGPPTVVNDLTHQNLANLGAEDKGINPIRYYKRASILAVSPDRNLLLMTNGDVINLQGQVQFTRSYPESFRGSPQWVYGNFTPIIEPTPTPSPTPTPTDPSQYYISCQISDFLFLRKYADLAQYVGGADNILDRLPPGTAVNIIGVEPVTATAEGQEPNVVNRYQNGINSVVITRQVEFVSVRLSDLREGYVAREATFTTTEYKPNGEIVSSESEIETYLYPDRESAGCESPPPPPQINTLDPARAAYYRLYKGAIFWAMYSELSMGQYVDQLDIVDASEAGNFLVPLPDDLPRYPGVIDRRDHRYLYARMIVSNLPTFTTSDTLVSMVTSNDVEGDGKTELYHTAFRYLNRWGDSLGNPTKPDLWEGSCDVIINNNLYSKYINVFNIPNSDKAEQGYSTIFWLNEYLKCSKDGPKVSKALRIFEDFIDTAIDDEIKNLPSPFSITNPGSGQAKVANICFVVGTLGCSPSGIDIRDFCLNNDINCRDATTGYWNSEQTGSPATTSVEQWLTSNPINYGIYDVYNDPYYLYPPTSAPTQVVYHTRVGYRYSITIAQFQSDNRPRYMLMGLGLESSDDTLAEAFDHHWRRLNYSESSNYALGSPQSYRPDYCMNGIAHVLRREGPEDEPWTETWVTLVFQTNADIDENGWFCTTEITNG
jgi:hypothetical protein